MSVATTSSDFGRGRPFVSLVLALGFLAAHHLYGMQQGEIYPALLLFLSLIAGLAMAGCVYPPVFFALTKWGQHLPMRFKVLGGLCAAAGAALGLYALITVY
jgi:hypothetical protein